MIDPISKYLHSGAGQHGPIMLMYHSVDTTGEKSDWPWAISQELFESHLDFLQKEGWQTVKASDLAAIDVVRRPRTLAITFDDGYTDNLIAAEMLHAKGMTATFYIVTGAIGSRPHWQHSGPERLHMLSRDDLITLANMGMEIGSHTVNHVRLTGCDPDKIQQELVSSRHELEAILGQKVQAFAYPYGDWNVACEKAAQVAGYTSACTTASGWTLIDKNPYRMRRITIYRQDSVSTLARKLGLGANDVGWGALGQLAKDRVRRKFARN